MEHWCLGGICCSKTGYKWGSCVSGATHFSCFLHWHLCFWLAAKSLDPTGVIPVENLTAKWHIYWASFMAVPFASLLRDSWEILVCCASTKQRIWKRDSPKFDIQMMEPIINWDIRFFKPQIQTFPFWFYQCSHSTNNMKWKIISWKIVYLFTLPLHLGCIPQRIVQVQCWVNTWLDCLLLNPSP